MKTIQVNQHTILVELCYKPKNRRIYLRVREGIVYITTPTRLSDRAIHSMLESNLPSIMKIMQQQDKIEDTIHYLGQSYPLILKHSTSPMVYIDNGNFIIETTHPDEAVKLTTLFYNDTLMNIVKSYGKDIQNKFNISDEIIYEYKNVKGYYGECFPKKKKIILASKLAKYELKYILSVIYHEFAHFKYPHHQKEFYEYLETLYPNYRSVQRALRKTRYNEKY